jgi:hypothetical protein
MSSPDATEGRIFLSLNLPPVLLNNSPVILCTKWTRVQAKQVTPSYSSALEANVSSDIQA